MSTLVELRKKVGGWLIVLIIWLGLWVPQGVCDEVMDCDRFFKALSAQYGGRFELIHGSCTALLWFTAVAGGYCALLIGLRKKGAVTTTKIGLLCITGATLLVDGLVLGIQPQFNIHMAVYCAKPVVWLSVWYAYLSRSKRVKETYVS